MPKPTTQVLLAALKAIIDDYELCAPDEAGNIDPWRKRLIQTTRTLIAKTEAPDA